MRQTLKKGTAVWLVQSWDNQGTVAITSCTVDSAGKVQVHLRREVNGVMMKHRFYTSALAQEPCWNGVRIVPVAGTDIQAYALAYGQGVVDSQRAHFARCLETSDSYHYRKNIEAEVAKLHEPRVINRTNEV